MSEQVTLSRAELDVALRYLEATNASDFFPQPFEIAALRHSWKDIRPVLQKVDLLNYSPKSPAVFTVAKNKYGFRIAHLLDPVDTLLYTALALHLAPDIQKYRDNLPKNVVFSYRYDRRKNSSAQTFASDWPAYKAEIDQKSASHGFVAVTDIVDFFPRIYHHRLENQLDPMCSDKHAVRALMKLIGKWADGTSYGIPTGPLASNFFAEALLAEVDEYLLDERIDFVRNIDDYSIFGDSEDECYRGLYRLAERLQRTQGLGLNVAKTRIRRAEYFRLEFVTPDDPTKQLRQEVMGRLFGGNPYEEIDYDALSEADKALVDKLSTEEALKSSIEHDLIDTRTVKLILNVMSASGRPTAAKVVVDNLGRLVPASDAVARFLGSLEKSGHRGLSRLGNRILAYIRQAAAFVPEYQSVWLLEPFTQSNRWNNRTNLRDLAGHHENYLVRRQAILALGEIGNRSSLLDLKSRLEEATEWEQRAIVFGFRKLPRDERRFAFSNLGIGVQWNQQNLLKKAVIEYAKSLV